MLATVNLRAQPVVAVTNAAPAPSPERFLLIVETSAAMEKRAENVHRVVGSIILNGLKGHLTDGSTLGLWTFNEQLQAGQLPLQLWTPTTRQRVAQKVVQVLENQKNEKAARLSAVWPGVTNLIARSEHLTLLFVTSGSEPITGTPYDALIAESFSKNAAEQRKNNMPFLTILRAAQGQLVSFAINTPPWPLEVPEYPEEFKPIPPPPPPPVTNPPPPVVKRPDRSVLSPTNIIMLAETSAPVEVPPLALPIAPTNQTSVAPLPVTNAPPSNPPAPAALIETQPATNATKATTASTRPATAPPERRGTLVLLAVGIGALLGVLVILLAMLRRARRPTGESLITRSMNQKDR
jgi:hypothetical protein